MWCEQREHLLADYRKVMAEHMIASKDGQINSALAKTRVDLQEHVEGHGCWTHAVYSSLFFLWRNQWTDEVQNPSTNTPAASISAANGA